MVNTSFTPQEIEQFLQEFFDVVGARQYIGARYIPIFGRAGSDTVEWDDLAPYEPLTVVMHDGVSYVSRRYVPAGIEITDTDYWVQTYRFNAQVEQYRQEVLSFQDQIDNRIPFPDPDFYPRYGELGQVLGTLTDGTVKWQDPVVPSDEQAEEVITAWLDDHPEATTTVEDASLTFAKFTQEVNDSLTRLLVHSNVRANSSSGTYSATVEDNAYLIGDVTISNNGYFYLATRDHDLSDLNDKEITLCIELLEGAGDIVLQGYLCLWWAWGPTENPVFFDAHTMNANGNNVIGYTFRLKDVYTPESGQTQITFAVRHQENTAYVVGAYKIRLWVMVNASTHAIVADRALVADTSKAIADNAVDYGNLKTNVNDTITRLLEHPNPRVNSPSGTGSYVILDNGCIEATLSITSNSYFYVATRGHDLSWLNDKELTLCIELLEGEGDIELQGYLGSGWAWSPTENPVFLDAQTFNLFNRYAYYSFRLCDVYTPASGQTEITFGVRHNDNTGYVAGSYKIRLWVMVNASSLSPMAIKANTAITLSDKLDTEILFWGDSLTRGAGGEGTTYPEICASALGKTYLNFGVGGETANTISARQGGNSIMIPAGPVNGTYQADDLIDVFGAPVHPLIQAGGYESAHILYVNGLSCNLTVSQSTYTISGYTGDPLTIPTPARFIGSDYSGEITVIFVGQNGSYVDGETDIQARIAIIDSMIAHLGNNRYVILALSTGTEAGNEADENALLNHYGDKLFKTRHMLSQYGLALLGITPTAQDSTDMSVGTVPTSLRSDGVHLNADGYTALGLMLADKIRALGYV